MARTGGTGGVPKTLEPPRKRFRILLDREVQEQLRDAGIGLVPYSEYDGNGDLMVSSRAMRAADPDGYMTAIEALNVARAAAAKAETTFVFRNLSREEKRELHDKYPPTEEQVKEAKEKGEPVPDVDDEPFTTEYLQRACVEPDLPDDWFQQNADGGLLSNMEIGALWNACMEAAVALTVVDWGKGSNGTRSSRRSSRTASQPESRTASSPSGAAAG